MAASLSLLLSGLLGGAVPAGEEADNDLQVRSGAAGVGTDDEPGRVCDKCGYRNDDDWRFCISCGKGLAAEGVPSGPVDVAELLRDSARAVFRVRSVVRVPVFSGRKKGAGGAEDRIRMSLGSAVLIDHEGTVVTSTRSLMQGATKAELISSDGESQVALLVAQDPVTELAVLRIQTGDLHPLEPCENEDVVESGDQAWYIGYPIVTNPDDGRTSILPQSIKETTISGVGVGGLERLQVEDFITFDAELNTATGGGALISSRGCLMGIGVEPRRTSVSLATAWNDTGRTAVSALKAGEVPVRYYLGLGLAHLTDFERRKYGIGRTNGVLVDFIIPGSPAAEADIQKGDLLVQVEQQTVDDAYAMHRDIPLTGESPVTLMFNRSGKPRKLVLAPALRPEQIKIDILDEVEQWFGLGFEAVLYGGISGTGLHVTALRPGGQGEKHLEVGDVLQKVNQSWVNDEESFRQMAGDNPNAIWMRIRRPSRGLFSLVYKRGYRTFRQPMVY